MKLKSYLSRMSCVLTGGHEWIMVFNPHLRVKCMRCLHETQGWALTVAEVESEKLSIMTGVRKAPAPKLEVPSGDVM